MIRDARDYRSEAIVDMLDDYTDRQLELAAPFLKEALLAKEITREVLAERVAYYRQMCLTLSGEVMR